MQYGVSVRAHGPYACFTRPELRSERVSYDSITPSAARGILEAIYWKPSIRWVIDRIHVLKPIRFQNLRRNEVAEKIPTGTVKTTMKKGRGRLELLIEEKRQQRASMLLVDVSYRIDAHFDLLDTNDGPPGKHRDIFLRRLRRGQCFQQPYFGTREFPVFFEEASGHDPTPFEGETPLGWMLHDIDFSRDMEPRFFNAVMRDGVIEVPPFHSPEVRA